MTAIAQGIRDLPNANGEEKLLKVCCLLKELDRDVESTFINYCPKSSPVVMEILHSITDDARSALCLNPKCANALSQVSRSKLKSSQNFFEPVLQIVFLISTEA